MASWNTLVSAVTERVVNVNGDGTGGLTASPYTALAGDRVVVGTDHGNVTINLPVLLAGQGVTVVQDSSTTWTSATITVTAPAAVPLGKPAPDNGSFTAAAGSVVFPYAPASGPAMTAAQSIGMSNRWVNNGAANGGYAFE